MRFLTTPPSLPNRRISYKNSERVLTIVVLVGGAHLAGDSAFYVINDSPLIVDKLIPKAPRCIIPSSGRARAFDVGNR